jgi:hypothetical protein
MGPCSGGSMGPRPHRRFVVPLHPVLSSCCALHRICCDTAQGFWPSVRTSGSILLYSEVALPREQGRVS